MVFNIKLLQGIPDDKIDLAKFVLFAIKEDVRMDNPLINKRESILSEAASIFWKDTVLLDVQDIIELLHERKIIKRDLTYGNKSQRINVRWILDRPLYVHHIEDELNLDYINSLRKYFKRDYSGVDRASSPAEVKKALIIFLENNPVDINKLPDVFKFYVDNRKLELGSQYIANILNFINCHEEPTFAGKDLKEYLSNSTKSKSNTFFSH